jgi:hypothetical protein
MKDEKELLIKKLLNGSISSEEIDLLMESIDLLEFRSLIKRVFDINESTTTNSSSASTGVLGVLNFLGRRKKNKRVKKRLDKPGFREGKNLIIAEGDSWFEYPLFKKDIIDWLIEDKSLIVYSLAYGGDWITNIIYEDEYISELSIYQPEVFLISGGGNDLVGDGRLGHLVNKPSIVDFEITASDLQERDYIISQGFGNSEISSEERADMIIRGKKFLNQDFYGLLKTFEIMYRLFFKNLDVSGKFDGMKVITQGYDFAIPSNESSFLKNPMGRISGNGKWLFYPLVRKNITNSYDQMSIVSAMIYYFNEMLIRVGNKVNEQNRQKNKRITIFHIDNRGLCKKEDWSDELHPKSYINKIIAERYRECVELRV